MPLGSMLGLIKKLQRLIQQSAHSQAQAYYIIHRNCSIISISRVKRANPQPLTWFRVSALRTYSREQCSATLNVQKRAGAAANES